MCVSFDLLALQDKFLRRKGSYFSSYCRGDDLKSKTEANNTRFRKVLEGYWEAVRINVFKSLIHLRSSFGSRGLTSGNEEASGSI